MQGSSLLCDPPPSLARLSHSTQGPAGPLCRCRLPPGAVWPGLGRAPVAESLPLAVGQVPRVTVLCPAQLGLNSRSGRPQRSSRVPLGAARGHHDRLHVCGVHLGRDAGADSLPHAVPGAQARGGQVRAASDTRPGAASPGPRAPTPPASPWGASLLRGLGHPGLQARATPGAPATVSAQRKGFPRLLSRKRQRPVRPSTWWSLEVFPGEAHTPRVSLATRRSLGTLVPTVPLLVPWPCARRPGQGRLLGADPTLFSPHLSPRCELLSSCSGAQRMRPRE